MRENNVLEESYWPADTTEDLLNVTVGELLRQIAADVPDRIALVDGLADPAKRRRWTYAQFLAAVEQTARALLKHFKPGERVAICSPNSAEWVLLQYGLNISGLVLVPINPAYKTSEIDVILRDSHSVGIFYAGQFRDNNIHDTVVTLKERLPFLRETTLISEFDAFIADYDPKLPLPEIALDQLLQIQFTSGTSGTPKGACLHHIGTLNTSRFVALRAGFPDGGVWLNAMPLYHVGGSIVSELGTLALRGTFIIAPAFDAPLMLEMIETEHVNAALFVPTMIIALLDHADFSRRNLSSMKTILTGAAVVPAALVHRTKSAFNCGLVILFGQTEVNGVVSQTTLDDSVEDQSHTMGRPLPQAEVKIADPETGAVQPIGVPGEICVRGYQTMHGYCALEEATQKTIGADGWLKTGDIAVLDSRGYLRITGRLKDMIIRGGMNVYPREIEDVLFDHPEVAEISVVGIPDAKWGEVIAAIIRPANPSAPPSPEALHTYCRAQIAAHKTPSLWFIIDAYPLTPSGKIQKFVLQDWINEGTITPIIWTRTSRDEVTRA